MRIQLLGAPAILVDGRRLEHPSRKAMALLAYLAMRADEHISRSHLAGLLWADSGEEQARANLRQTLSQLRKLFQSAGADPILVPFDKIVLRSEGLEIDARALLSGPATMSLRDIARLPAFLEGLDVGAPEFEAWLGAQRRLIGAALVDHLAARAEAKGGSEAVEALSLALQFDPLREPLHRALMSALAAQGRSDEALKQYEACRSMLARELQVEPDAETRALAAKIRSGRRNSEPAAAPTPTAMPARIASSGPEGGLTWRDFATAQEALAHALTVRRGNPVGGPQAVVPAGPGSDHEAGLLLEGAAAAEIVVSPALFERFRDNSHFSFEERPRHPDGPASYRLLSELFRHRLILAPTVPAPAVPSVPEFSVAVLPLQDGAAPGDPYRLGELMAEEIILRLSRYRGLTIAAPTAGKAFRALAHPAERAREVLGVNYLLDGSVQRDGERLEIRLSLTDLRANHLVFSHRFTGRFPDSVFENGELVDQIATVMFHKAQGAEMQRAAHPLTRSGSALEWFLRGLAAHRRAGILPSNARDAFQYFSNAVEVDPQFARAIAWRLCAVSWFDTAYLFDPGMQHIQQALAIDEEDAEIHRVAGALHLYRGDSMQAIHHMERAIALNPSDAYLLATSAIYLAFAGQPEKGLALIERAMRLDPFLPSFCVEDHGIVLYVMGDMAGAIASLQRLPSPRPRALAYLAAAQVGAGLHDAARGSIGRLRSISPQLTPEQFLLTEYYSDAAAKDALRATLGQAGFA